MNVLQNKYIKLVFVLLVSFFISDFSIKNVFLTKSPRIDPFLGQKIVAKLNDFKVNTGNFVASLNPFSNLRQNNFENSENSNVTTGNFSEVPSDIMNALSSPLNKISQGVYAGEKDGIQVYEIKTGEIEYLVYTFKVNGKDINIKIPKDQKPPTQQEVEGLFR